MGIYTKSALAILGLTLSCTPALARQTPQGGPAAAQQGHWAGPGNPGDPAQSIPPRRERVRVWVTRQGGRGFAARGPGMGMGTGFGIGMGSEMRGVGIDGRLAIAQRALRDPEIRQRLGISDQQAARLQQDVTNFRKTLIQARANLAIQRIDLQNLLAAENPDRAAVDSKLKQVGEAQMALEKAAVDFALTIKQEIPPAQREKIRQFLRERRQRGRGPGRDGAMMRRGGVRGPRPAPDSQGQQGGAPQQPNQ